jgi:hypothetical protein
MAAKVAEAMAAAVISKLEYQQLVILVVVAAAVDRKTRQVAQADLELLFSNIQTH